MMMKPNFESGNQYGNGDGETNWNNGQLLLQDIQEISKALYLNNTPSRPSFSTAVHNRSKSAGKARLSQPQVTLTPRFLKEDLFAKDKKLSSAWNWKKPLKALTRMGDHKFKCCFNLHVHSVEGLPLSLDGTNLCVHWKRKSSILQTRPSRVFHGAAEFEETLTHGCSIYVGRAMSSHSVKYEPKRFLIYASIVGEPEHDIGNRQVDLTRLLPLTLAELGGDKSSGTWSTSFRLAGKAVGASLNVSFSYQVMKGELMDVGGDNLNVLNLINLKSGRPSSTGSVVDFGPSNRDIKLRQAGSLPCEPHNGLVIPFHSDDVILSHETFMNSGSSLSKSISFLYQKLDEGNFHDSAGADTEHFGPLKSHAVVKSESPQESDQHDPDDTEFTIIEQVETLEGDSLKLDQTGIHTVDLSIVEIINVDDILKDDDIFLDKNTGCDSIDNICTSCVNGTIADDSKHKCSRSCVNIPCIKAVDIVLEASELPDQEDYLSVKSNYKAHRMGKKSHSLDDITESVANDFLNMLAMESGSFGSGCDGDPQSPREQLLRQFEKEAQANFTFDFDENKEELRTDILGHSCEDVTLDSDLSLFIQAAEEEHARENQSLMLRRKAKILEDLETDSLMQQWGLNERDFENSLETCSGGFGSPIELSNEESSMLPSIGQGLGSFVQIMGGGFLRSMSPSLFRNAKTCASLITQASNPVILPAKMGNDILEILLHMASAGVEEMRDHIYKSMPLLDITGKSIEHIVQDATNNKGDPGRQGSWQHDLFEFPCDNLTNEDMDLDSVSLEAVAPMTVNKIESLFIEGLRIQSGMFYEEAPSYIRAHHTKIPAVGVRRDNLRGFAPSERVAKLQVEDGVEVGNDDDGLMGLSITLDQWLRLDSSIIDGEQNSEKILNILKAHHSKIRELDDQGLKNGMDQLSTHGINHELMGNFLTVAFMIQLRDPLRNFEPVGVPMLVLTQVERVHILAGVLTKAPQFRFKISQIHLAGVLTKARNKQLWGTAAQQQSGFRWLLASGMASTFYQEVAE
ncbi:protein PLASTID MOVEMENT IMPAIRED 1-RELATED 1 [Abrus precatorius]|uniref:Protein PLASTID MOVEMENT IMPAIRED 1-RELATED 1 n=1 Tax=Abrus precatorius TaxID=3816 RepID=A0A8B8JGC0_ABRPR|nr:protein PLASTID MOVEMENT IMPAIRED 1-RELATED 1 [Abrus precatorius]XP_027330274.1 protein PLASTID MOVEMENT IMPAIRED 1-RELATED 1 [Abrus precatorius]XP_027330275.1 protein PLASTID MOVEMENT IMPAIRED 1-RELATED 1 [Abrus precatorius]